MDVGNPESIAEGFAAIARDAGRSDVLVNCAGIATMLPFIDYPLDVYLKTMQVNVTGTLLCAQHAARMMRPNGWGRIVNIAYWPCLQGRHRVREMARAHAVALGPAVLRWARRRATQRRR